MPPSAATSSSSSALERASWTLPVARAFVLGLAQGSKRTVLLKPEHAFGQRNPEAQVEVERSEFPEDVAPGDCYEAEDEDGRPVLLQVLDVSEEGVVVDSNHPLAGQTLRFEV